MMSIAVAGIARNGQPPEISPPIRRGVINGAFKEVIDLLEPDSPFRKALAALRDHELSGVE
jgi:hypothetical protein